MKNNLNQGPVTQFYYLYRDAANYKIAGRIMLSGSLTASEQAEIISYLETDHMFIAEQIGIPSLRSKLYEFSDGPTSDDHCWHEFVRFSEDSDGYNKDFIWGTAADLLERFRMVDRWQDAGLPFPVDLGLS